MHRKSQSERKQYEQKEKALRANEELLSEEKKAMQSENARIAKRERALMRSTNEQSAAIRSDLDQWISDRQSAHSLDVDAEAEQSRERMAAKLRSVNERARRMVSDRASVWKESNDELDGVLIELDDKERAMAELSTQLQNAQSTLQRQSRELRDVESRFEDERVGHLNALELEHQALRKQLESETQSRGNAEAELLQIIAENKSFCIASSWSRKQSTSCGFGASIKRKASPN